MEKGEEVEEREEVGGTKGSCECLSKGGKRVEEKKRGERKRRVGNIGSMKGVGT